MKLAAILNVWADAVELLPYCVRNLADCGVDGIIIIWSEASNYGEVKRDYLRTDFGDMNLWFNNPPKIHFFQREPFLHHPANCETDKRNFGLEKARELGYTHFLTMDQDEFYEPEKFKEQWARFKDPNLKGLVCLCQTYFKSPTLTIGLDTTIVPFIHELQPRIKHEFNRKYPFAWEDGKIRIDPTRSLSINLGVERTDLIMHHYSWVRRDIQMKIRNSSARTNIQRSTILNDLVDGKEGYYVEFYRKRLTRCPNLFGIPEYVSNPEGTAIFREDLQPGAAGDRLHLPN